MKKILFCLIAFTATVSAQNTDYNTKKGFMANGYDVVAFFLTMKPLKETKLSKQHMMV